MRVGRAPLVPRGATATGVLRPSTVLELDVVLKPSDPQALSVYAHAVSSPGSPDFRDYLSPAAFAERFGAPTSTVASVEADLRGKGFSIEGESRNRLVVRAATTARLVDRAWGISLERYRLAGGQSGFANNQAPQLPTQLAGDVAGIVGLDSLGSLQTQAEMAPRREAVNKSAAR